MAARTLPPREEMVDALMERDSSYEGVFVAAVITTGVFCRPTCPARKPRPENVEFFTGPRVALAHGYRPCKRCRPLERKGETPGEIRELLERVEEDPSRRLSDRDLEARGLSPRTVRRWFKRHHGMTFHDYQRGRRLAKALAALSDGARITDTAFGAGYESLSGFQAALSQLTGCSPSASREIVPVHLSRYLTPLGPMVLGVAPEGVCLLEFADRPMLETQLERLIRRLNCAFVPGATEVTRQMTAELDAYFEGSFPGSFTTPLVTPGSEFQRAVWTELRSIPYGTTRSYAEQARRLGRPGAVRAVGRANGDNRIAIVIPCHRVRGSDGRLRGYGGGVWRKRWLLQHEGVTRPESLSPGCGSGSGCRTCRPGPPS